VPAIYSAEGGRLRVCESDGERPTEFRTQPGDGRTLFVWERAAAATPSGPAPADGGPPAAREDEGGPATRYAFQMRDQPWNNVLEWLTEISGLPVVTSVRPAGTFNYVVRAEATLTLPEIIDVLNDALIQQNFLLIRRDNSFTLVPTDERVPPQLVPFIPLEELPLRGKTEVVKVILPLSRLSAEAQATEARKLLSPFGEAVALTDANALSLQDSAGALTEIVETIRGLDNDRPTDPGAPDGPEPVSRIFALRHVDALELGRVLERAAGQKGLKLFLLQPDHRTNSLLVRATEADLDTISGLIQELDRAPDEPSAEDDIERAAGLIKLGRIQEAADLLRRADESLRRRMGEPGDNPLPKK
jgi:type II secretory pathway component GspD/PulD (secretin)